MSFEEEKEECLRLLKEAKNSKEKAKILWAFLKKATQEELLKTVADDQFWEQIPRTYDNLVHENLGAATDFSNNLDNLFKVWNLNYIFNKMFYEYDIKKDIPLEKLFTPITTNKDR